MPIFVEEKWATAGNIRKDRGFGVYQREANVLVSKDGGLETLPYFKILAYCPGRHTRRQHRLKQHVTGFLRTIPVEYFLI